MLNSEYIAESFFNAALFERALSFSALMPPSWRVSCLIELERYEEAFAAAQGAVDADPTNGELLALLALAQEGRAKISYLIELNQKSVQQGSAVGLINLARIYTSEGRLEEVPDLLSSLNDLQSVKPRHRLRLDLILLQVYSLMDRKKEAFALRDELVKSLSAAPLYESALIMLFLAKHEFIVGKKIDAQTYLKNLHALLSSVPPCRLHSALSHSAKLIKMNRGAALPLIGSLEVLPSRSHVLRTIQILKRKPVLNALFQCILAGGEEGVERSDISSSVWGLDYNPLRDDERIYKALRRLRSLLEDMDPPEFQLISVSDRIVASAVAYK